tara:strand:- start:412 stop:1128 length:717 start_codon:yes stop_codon:yes gene_type:complete
MTKNVKIAVGLIYILCLGLILYGFFIFVDVTQLNDYRYIRDKTQFLIEVKDDNPFLFTFVFFLFAIIWILLLGFATPISLIAGFIFGKFYGTLISVFGFTIGCTLLYFLANQYFKDLILTKLSNRMTKFKDMFNKNEFLYFMIFRFAGGGGTPFAIQNLLPVFFNMRLKNYFFSTLIGLFPMVFVLSAIGEGIENVIDNNIDPSFLTMIQNKEILFPIIGFFIILIISFLLRKIFFKK